VKLHPNLWTSWGLRELDDKLLEFAMEMNLDQVWEDIMTKAKKATTYGLELKLKGMLFKFDLALHYECTPIKGTIKHVQDYN
jgi:hypothetical protein